MKTAQPGVDLIKEFEGLRLTAYYDAANVLTIGYGHTNYSASASKYPVYPGQVITANEAETILKADLASFESIVNDAVTTSISQNQFDSLVSFTFNLGGGTLRSSDLLKKTNQRDFLGAAEEFGLYIHAGGQVLEGLVRRREAEKQLYLKGISGIFKYGKVVEDRSKLQTYYNPELKYKVQGISGTANMCKDEKLTDAYRHTDGTLVKWRKNEILDSQYWKKINRGNTVYTVHRTKNQFGNYMFFAYERKEN